MKKHSYKLPERSAKKDFVFNMFGSTANAAVSVLLLVIVSHLAGETGAGIFSLCFTTAQMMYTVAAFELRNIQVTDAKREFTFSDVLTFRFITIIVMLIASAVVVAVRGFSGTKAVLTLLLCLYMAMLSVSDRVVDISRSDFGTDSLHKTLLQFTVKERIDWNIVNLVNLFQILFARENGL